MENIDYELFTYILNKSIDSVSLRGTRKRIRYYYDSEEYKLVFHIKLVNLLSSLTEGSNVNTEIQCQSLLSMTDVVRVVTHQSCLYEVKNSYVLYLLSCYLESEVEFREMNTASILWSLLEGMRKDIDLLIERTLFDKYIKNLSG